MSSASMQSGSTAEHPPLRLTRVFDAPRELVFKAFTEAEHLSKWWGPKHFINPRCEFEARPGGKIDVVMHCEGFGTFPMGGTVHEVIPPEKLVFTSTAFGDDASGWGLEVLNTLTFEEQGGRTVLHLLAEVRKAEAEAQAGLGGMAQGWKESFLKLENLLAGEPLEFDDLEITTPGDTEIQITRSFKAAPEELYAAFTTPEYVSKWWGGCGMMQMKHCSMDVRVGGKWRFVLVMHDGTEHGFNGEYLQLDPPRRMVQTFCYEPIPGAESVETAVLEPVEGGTRLRVLIKHKSQENRDGHLNSGMEFGLRQSYDALETLLAEQKSAALLG